MFLLLNVSHSSKLTESEEPKKVFRNPNVGRVSQKYRYNNFAFITGILSRGSLVS